MSHGRQHRKGKVAREARRNGEATLEAARASLDREYAPGEAARVWFTNPHDRALELQRADRDRTARAALDLA
jgi:hypothetical protein